MDAGKFFFRLLIVIAGGAVEAARQFFIGADFAQLGLYAGVAAAVAGLLAVLLGKLARVLGDNIDINPRKGT